MRCNEFDTLIDEMLSGILHPEANQHLRECERCNSHLRARTQVQQGLRKLAVAAAEGPSRATDRAVMEAYRRLQAGRGEGQSQKPALEPASRVLSFPARAQSAWNSRALWSSAAAAAVVFAVLGTSARLWHNTPVAAPIHSSAQAGLSGAAPKVNSASVASLPSSNAVRQLANRALRAAGNNVVQPRVQSAPASTELASAQPGTSGTSMPRNPVILGAGQSYDSVPVTEGARGSSVLHLASAGEGGNVAQSASSTWPGYSNLMYCDPVACSGPMQVVHIKVPVEQVKPNLGQSSGNGFVNADVLVGPDGVARAIRVAN